MPGIEVVLNEHGVRTNEFRTTDFYGGGSFMASTISNTIEVCDALLDTVRYGIDDPEKHARIVEKDGGCEHLRPLLGRSKKLDANELIWMNFRTPHQILPQSESGYREFFSVGQIIGHQTHLYLCQKMYT